MRTLLILIGTQALYTSGDFMARYYMSRRGFNVEILTSAWFWVYTAIRQVATLGQLYIFASIPLGKTMALFAATSVVLSNVVGFLFLAERLSAFGYIGVVLAVCAILVLTIR
jgi:uncharacterized membrane protein